MDSPSLTILTDVFTRVRDQLTQSLDGLTADDLCWRPDPDANPIGWLAWHLSRVQDDHLAGVAGRLGLEPSEQVWTSGGWVERFGLPYGRDEHGFGHSRTQVDGWRGEPELIVGYHAAVTDLTLAVVDGLDEAAYGRIVDERWDPPVTAAARLVSVVDEVNQHLGQVDYVRGLLERR